MSELMRRLREIDIQTEKLKEERREIYRQSLNVPPEEKVCSDFVAEGLCESSPFPEMKYPLNVTGIHWVEMEMRKRRCFLVKVRPATENKTYLGIYVGDLPLGISASYHKANGVLSIREGYYNPAIVVPALGRLVMGCESWWSKIEDEKDLEDISDGDINNVWYVRALREMVNSGK